MQNNVTPTDRGRMLYVDMLRVLACFLVILTHSTRPADASMGVIVGLMAYIGSPSSELFLSLSGAVLLPVKTGFRAFYRRRFLKLIPPFVFWSLVILLISYAVGEISGPQLLGSVLYMPFQQVVGVYWFIYVMIGLYLFAPFISYWLRAASRRQIEWFFVIWLVNLLLPYLDLIFPGMFNLNGDHYWALNYFGGFLGYWLLGYYLRMYPIRIGLNFRFLFITAGVLFNMSMIVYARFCTQWDIPALYDNLQVGSMFIVAMLYTVAQNIHITGAWLRRAIVSVAKASFGIYLIHLIVVRRVVWMLFDQSTMHPLPETLLIAVISFALCYAIVKLISLLPHSRYIVGV